MGKYESYDHPSGVVRVGDQVAAFVPTANGRAVRWARVNRINRLSIKVGYWENNSVYETTLKDHQWCFIRGDKEVIVDRNDFEKLVEDQKFLDALLVAGVDKWDGYDDVVAGE